MIKGFIPIKSEHKRTWYMCVNCGYTMPASSEPQRCPICENAQEPPESARAFIQPQKAPF